jgi:hypothetical protein
MRDLGTAYMKASSRDGLRFIANRIGVPLEQLLAAADLMASAYNAQINGISVPGNPPEAYAKLGQQLADLIGGPNEQKLATAIKDEPALRMATEVTLAVGTDDSLSPQQTDQVAEALTKNQVQAKPDNWPAAIAALAPVLSPGQLQVLQTYASSKTGIDYTGGLAP